MHYSVARSLQPTLLSAAVQGRAVMMGLRASTSVPVAAQRPSPITPSLRSMSTAALPASSREQFMLLQREGKKASGTTNPTPAIPLSPTSPLVQDAVYRQFIGNLMKQGKRAVYERILNQALVYIQTHYTPTASPSTGFTVTPRLVLTQAVEAVAPFLKVTSSKRGSKNILTPTPLTDLQRRRLAILWIVDAANGKRGGSAASRLSFGERLGKEIIAVMRGESASLLKKTQLHKQALSNRSNLIMVDRKRRG